MGVQGESLKKVCAAIMFLTGSRSPLDNRAIKSQCRVLQRRHAAFVAELGGTRGSTAFDAFEANCEVVNEMVEE